MATKDKPAGREPEAGGTPVPETEREDVATIEEWREIRCPDAWVHEAAKCLCGWPIGQVVKLSDYDAALASAQKIEVS